MVPLARMTTHARAWAAALLIAGVAIATAVESVSERTSPKVGPYWILAGDFHVHAFPGDGSLPPWMVRSEARHAGIAVFAIANHNQVFTARLGRWLSETSNGPLVIVGSEITNPRYHLIAVGIEHPVDSSQTAAQAIEAVHAQGGVAIAAHPSRGYWAGWDDRAISLLDGVERAHPAGRADANEERDFDAFYDRARRLRANVAPIGSSDFHASPSLGECRTYVFTRERSQAGVLEAIRNGRTVAEDGEGRLYGEPSLVRAIEANRVEGRTDERRAWRRAALACAWTGLVGLLLLRGVNRD
jgi:hypothetical protein